MIVGSEILCVRERQVRAHRWAVRAVVAIVALQGYLLGIRRSSPGPWRCHRGFGHPSRIVRSRNRMIPSQLGAGFSDVTGSASGVQWKVVSSQQDNGAGGNTYHGNVIGVKHN